VRNRLLEVLEDNGWAEWPEETPICLCLACVVEDCPWFHQCEFGRRADIYCPDCRSKRVVCERFKLAKPEGKKVIEVK